MVELYVKKGIERQDAERMTDILANYKSAWVDVMMVEELGILEASESPLKNALVTFSSFGIFGFVPLLAYVAARFLPFFEAHAFALASVLTAATLVVLGVQKTRFTNKHWFSSGSEMLLVGGIGALLSGLA